MLKKRKKSKKHYEFDESDKGFRDKKQHRQKPDKGNIVVGKKGGKTDWRDLIEDEEEEQNQEFVQDEE